MFSHQHCNVAIVGGGFYGCFMASEFSAQGLSCILLESETDLMTRASYNNQARLHAGYHYPRNFNTARRAQALMPRFKSEFASAIKNDFTAVYGISQQQSKVTAKMFEEMMAAIGAPLRPTDPSINNLFTKGSLEQSYSVEEPVFDASILRALMRERLKARGTDVRLSSRVERIKRASPSRLRLSVRADREYEIEAEQIYLCNYGGMNSVLRASNLPAVSLQHQWTEICLVRLPPALAKYGFTIMDGPFFSLLPFPDRGCHSLSHVQFTPHRTWEDSVSHWDFSRKTAFIKMQKDAARWLPALNDAEYIDSLWEVKTLLPKNLENDGRPILQMMNYHEQGLHLILGGKIDNALELAQSSHQQRRIS
jgi:glycine/D-amino acid oxidase-like deaminating enzyme